MTVPARLRFCLQGRNVMSKSSLLATVVAAGVIAAAGACMPEAAHAQTKVVRVWHTETEPQTIKAFNDIARRFEAKNPGVKIEAEGLAWGDLEGKIMAGLAAGNPPELSHGQPITRPAPPTKGVH